MKNLLLVNKPKGMTSHDVVDQMRRITKIRKIGHGGTLDPNATGLLIIGVGREGTRQLGNISKGLGKTYIAEIELGRESTTDDPEGVLTEVSSLVPDVESINRVVAKFLGTISQKPPVFSAIKIGGKKSYNEARRGNQIDLPDRTVTVHKIKLIEYSYPILVLECTVSSGTYIRALARDIGRELNTGAYLKNLKRTRIGKYRLEDAADLEHIRKVWK